MTNYKCDKCTATFTTKDIIDRGMKPKHNFNVLGSRTYLNEKKEECYLVCPVCDFLHIHGFAKVK